MLFLNKSSPLSSLMCVTARAWQIFTPSSGCALVCRCAYVWVGGWLGLVNKRLSPRLLPDGWWLLSLATFRCSSLWGWLLGWHVLKFISSPFSFFVKLATNILTWLEIYTVIGLPELQEELIVVKSLCILDNGNLWLFLCFLIPCREVTKPDIDQCSWLATLVNHQTMWWSWCVIVIILNLSWGHVSFWEMKHLGTDFLLDVTSSRLPVRRLTVLHVPGYEPKKKHCIFKINYINIYCDWDLYVDPWSSAHVMIGLLKPKQSEH